MNPLLRFFVNMTQHYQVISNLEDLIENLYLMFYFTGEYLKVTERPQTSFDLFFNCICSYRPLPPHLGKHLRPSW